MENKNNINKVVIVPCNGQFFRAWLEFLKPLHHLTSREMDVAALIFECRDELSKNITNEDLLDKVLMSEETRRIIKDKCGVSTAHFQAILTKLRKNGVIKEGVLNSKYIPNIDGKTEFNLLLKFKL